MRSGLRLARIFGIELYADGSWVFIFLLLSFNLTILFSRWHPAWGPLPSMLVAVVASLLFFASVVVHELAHSLVARAHGITVRNITLFLFGGVSSFEREPPSPRAEFLTAVVGPLASFAMGVVFFFLGSLVLGRRADASLDPREALAASGPVATILLWLGPINVIIAVFNLIPGFPLDGGRVLRAALWALTKDLRRATRWASWVGQAIAWSFIAAGVAMAFGVVLPVLGTGLVGGLWLAFIGWFLRSAAEQSYKQVVLRDLLEGTTVARVMRPSSLPVEAGLRVRELVDDWLMRSEERAFPVMRGGVLVGLVCLEDVRKAPREAWEHTPVEAVMTPVQELEVVPPGEDLADALDRMMRKDVAQLPVLEDGRIVGMLRRRDISRWLELQPTEEGGARRPQVPA